MHLPARVPCLARIAPSLGRFWVAVATPHEGTRLQSSIELRTALPHARADEPSAVVPVASSRSGTVLQSRVKQESWLKQGE